MKLALSSQIKEIDAFCRDELGIPTRELMAESGKAVAAVVRAGTAEGGTVAILAGKGNNGGDGYAAACDLLADRSVTVYDIFSEGQNTEESRYFRSRFEELGGRLVSYDASPETLAAIKGSSAIVDAIFGTGFQGEVPESLRSLAIAIRESVEAKKTAIDVPLGINADNGSVSSFAISVNATVELSMIKAGIASYPARSFVGEIVFADLGLPTDKIKENFSFKYSAMTEGECYSLLPKRGANTNKGSFGKLLVITGSERYRGAAHLSVEAALRGGVGLVTFAGSHRLASELSAKYPEVIYKEYGEAAELSPAERRELSEFAEGFDAVLVGSGSSNTEGLLLLVRELLARGKAPVILDADAINALASSGAEGREALKNSPRQVILTPHPLEFSRLAEMDVAYVQQHRIEVAKSFAAETGTILVLKGAGTLVTDGDLVSINLSGSSALAKAGSGDVLAGLLGALAAQSSIEPFRACQLAVAFHAIAGDRLAREFSSYGVTPSDLPKEIARVMSQAVTEDGKSIRGV